MSRQRTRLLILLSCGLLVLARLSVFVLSVPFQLYADEDCSFQYLTLTLLALAWLALYGVIAMLLVVSRLWRWPDWVYWGIALVLAMPYGLAVISAAFGLLAWASLHSVDVMALYGLLLGVTLYCWWCDTLALLAMAAGVRPA